ncbi:ABC transporter permease [Weissella viridescens]|nr:ABC transporter permease [Weissella viridescens]
MRHEKGRYGLIIAVIGLISFLIFIISALALGLAHQNTASIDSWHTKSVLMTKDANGNLAQSVMTAPELRQQKRNQQSAVVGITPTNINRQGASNHDGIQFVGLNTNEYIYQNMPISKGHRPQRANEVIISDKLSHYHLNDKIKIGLDDNTYTISGITPDALYNMAPVVYGQLTNWNHIKGVNQNFKASGIVSKATTPIKTNNAQLQLFNHDQFLKELPGYSAQNTTFIFMIVFLIIIALVVVTIFLYILTLQKRPNFAVLRAQGIPNRYLLRNTFSETLLLMLFAVILGCGLTTLTATIIPSGVPMYFDIPLMFGVATGILVTGLLGSCIPMLVISKIDPVTVIGG